MVPIVWMMEGLEEDLTRLAAEQSENRQDYAF
jgi:hypothetical protein